jgi:exopolysaccharide production protein ExoZ
MIISSTSLVNKNDGYKIFLAKRIIRIVPIYWIMTTYKLILILLIPTSLVVNQSLNIDYILKSYFFFPAMNSNGQYFPLYNVGWTLNFEMFFYLLFAIALLFRISPLKFFSLTFILISFLFKLKTQDWPAVGYFCDPIILNFLSGIIAATLILNNIKLSATVALPILFLSLLYLFLPRTIIVARLFGNNTIGLFAAAFLTIYAGASVETKIGKLIPSWLLILGAASYSLYLVHPIVAPFGPILTKMLKLKWGWLSVILAIIISIGGGYTFYRFCEVPLTRFFSRSLRKWKLNDLLKKTFRSSYSWFNVSNK